MKTDIQLIDSNASYIDDLKVGKTLIISGYTFMAWFEIIWVFSTPKYCSRPLFFDFK
jgi:hypothetical protein